MMGLESIVRLNSQIARDAALQRLVPFHPDNVDEIEDWPPFPFPNLGYHCPDGWAEDEDTHWFCDKSGCGRDSEPALTINQLKRVLTDYLEDHPQAGFAIVEEGQFQVYVSAFLPTTAA